ncbi:uncharacterized protein LOC135139113 isoform X1 [Zophobas morio]|uniref:uncharacterized protein LOC135139113 isoform X1 n=2 Tax=Zophobas morio TaxID=2755281 RepID=UPI003083B472
MKISSCNQTPAPRGIKSLQTNQKQIYSIMENTQESLDQRRRRLLEELQLLDQQIAESSGIQQQPAPKHDVPETESTQQAPQENIEENNENQQLQSNTSPQVDQISSNETETDVQPTVSPNFCFYEKRKGVVDLGRGYEYLTCTLYALKFGLDENVSDFRMTTNNKKCGDFDDIEIEATFKNGKRSTFLFQLKHKFNKEYITESLLTNETIHKNKKQQKSKFYLPHYLQSISNFEKQDEDLHFILYTNSQAAIKGGSELSFNKKYTSLLVEDSSNLEYKELLVNSDDDENKIFKVKPNGDSETEELKSVANVCSKFYFFTNQDDIESVKGSLKVKLDNLLQSQYDILDPFLQFMEYWWSENFVLTKHLLLVKLTELALSPYIKTLTGKRTSEKTDLLKRAIMDFEMTIVGKSQEEIVVNMWKEVEENNDCNTSPLDQYAQQRKTELSRVQKAKILWHWGKIPLIITVDKSNANVVERVMKLLHKSLQNKKVLLLTDDSNYQFHGWSIFKTLSDIIENHPNEEYCSNIKNKFNVSLQGRNYIPLRHLLQTDINIARYVRTEDLFVMSQCQYMLIGKQVEKPPDLYIPRTVYANFINIQQIFKLAGLMRSNAIIINCHKSFTNRLVKYFEVIELSDYLSTEIVKLNNNCIFVSTKSKCGDKKFDEFCEKSKEQNVYLLQVVDQKYCILIRRRGKQTPFRFRRKCIEEANIFAKFKDLLNVFCAPPGMGKTSLLKILNYNCPRDCWAVNIDLINYNSVFAKESNLRELLHYFIEVKDSQDDLLTKHIISTLLRDKKMHVFFDGLDEVHSNYVKLVMDCIQHLFAEGVNVWVTSRENLREQLSQTLNIVPIDIEEIRRNEQKSYIYDRLIDKYQPEEIQKITTAMSDSVDLNRSQALLGIPLQLYIITEMFVNNKQVYEDLMQEGLFVLTKMYRMFFDGKIESCYKKVIGDNQEHQLGVIRFLLKQYELVAVKTCLDASDFEKLALNTQESQEFIDELKSNGDKYGIIKNINEYEEVVFNHQTYAEYFASVWFKKHQDKVRLLGGNFFSKRYENLRIMFDVMMAEKNPLHLAVIYKDIHQCEKQIENVGTKDEAGRNALHIACSYGINYPEDEARINRESTTYTKIIAMLFGKPEIKIKIAERDDLFNFDCVEYALASKCLYVIETLFEKSLLTFQGLQTSVFQFYDEKALVYYAAQMGYFNLFFEITTSNSSIEKNKSIVCCALQF